MALPRLPNSLFFRTAATLFLSKFLLVALSLSAIVYFVAYPLVKQSTGDLASLIWFAAQTWVEVPPETRPDLAHELLESHRLRIEANPAPLAASRQSRPYLQELQRALEERSGAPVPAGNLPGKPDEVWVDLSIADTRLRFSFARERIGASPPIALFLIAVASLLLVAITSLVLSRQLTRPLAYLSRATHQIGQSGKAIPLQIQGADELVSLAADLNQMAVEIESLLENRTVLLSGISHDLRTPLTRMMLALEMIGSEQDSVMVDALKKDVQAMDGLLRDTLLLARGIEGKEAPQEVDLVQWVTRVIENYPFRDNQVLWQPAGKVSWKIPPQSLERVLENLFSNALRYGDCKPISVRLDVENGVPEIQVLDEGPGIPDEQLEAVFRPFYRLESSRSTATGGSGLGLAIVRQLCQAQHWPVRLFNRDPQGLGVRVRLG